MSAQKEDQNSDSDPRNLVDLDDQAYRLMRENRYADAADIFEQILKSDPAWDAGTAVYHLAICYEELEQFEMAESAYCRAIEYRPTDPAFVGGLASFHYLHSDPRVAYDAYLRLLALYRDYRNFEDFDQAAIALRTLGKQIDLSQTKIEDQINAIRQQGKP